METIPLSIPIDFDLIDNTVLQITWKDSSTTHISLTTLLEHCPCILCKQKNKNHLLSTKPKLKKIEFAGRYAIKFTFQNGCSKGIFPFELLHDLPKLG